MLEAEPLDDVAAIDTETSGIFNFKLAADDPSQPRLAAFGAIVCNPALVEIKRIGRLVKPDGWVLTEEAARVNGLTMERLEAEGVPVKDVLEEYAALIRNGYVITSWNAQFDCKMMRGEFRRAGMDDLFEQTRNVCTMRASMKLGIKKESGKGGFPKLSDACTHFGIENTGAHTAEGDAEVHMEIYRRMKRLGALPAAEVHHARADHPALAGRDVRPAVTEPAAAPMTPPDPDME